MCSRFEIIYEPELNVSLGSVDDNHVLNTLKQLLPEYSKLLDEDKLKNIDYDDMYNIISGLKQHKEYLN